MSLAPDSPGTVGPHPGGLRGTLRTSAGDELPVQTYEGGDEVVLLVLSEVNAPPSDGPDPATLEYASLRGIVRIQGEAVFAERSLVRFHADGDPEVIQRRAFVRVHSSHQIAINAAGAHDGGFPAHTVDVSGGGLLLFGADHLRRGDVVRFEMSVGGDEPPVRGVARVVRIDADGRRGLQFERIDEADRQRLIRLVFTCMRASRAKTRGDLA